MWFTFLTELLILVFLQDIIDDILDYSAKLLVFLYFLAYVDSCLCSLKFMIAAYVVCLSVGLATEVPKLTHYWVVLFHPRA